MKVLHFTLPVAHEHSVIVQQDDQPYFYPYLHRHNEAQLTYIASGEGTIVAGTNMQVFKPGDIFFLGPNQAHIFKSDPQYFEADSLLRINTLTIFFDPETKLSALFQLPEMQLIKQFVDQHAGGFKIPAGYRAPVLERMLTVKDARNAGRMAEFVQLLQFLYSIRQQLTPLTDGALDKMSDTEGIRIGHIYNFAMQNYPSAISLDDIAAEVHMTPQAFCRYFKKHTGNTFITFLNKLRINEACKMMSIAKVEGISSVAYACGFNSITNFNRTFKAIMGSSPTQYLEHAKALVSDPV